MLNAVFAASYFGGNHDTFRLMNRKQTKEVFCNITLTKKKCWVILTQFWVKYGHTQPLGYIFK